MPSFITSPDLVNLASRMKALDTTEVYQEAANQVALTDLEPRIVRAAAQAGVSGDLLDLIGTYTRPDNEVYVGVPANHPLHEEAMSYEYGSLTQRPADFVAGTVASRQRPLNEMFATELTRALRSKL